MKNIARKGLHKRAAQSGQVVIEMIGGLVIFSMMLALVMSISAYLYFQQALVTAAREGAREASLNNDIGTPGSENKGVTTVKNYVSDTIEALTGQETTTSVATITVVPPSQSLSQASGDRTVRVDIQWKMTNPVGVAGLMDALGGDGSHFRTIPVYATATMRYEE